MVGMPEFLAKILTRFLTRFLARFLTRVFGSENTVYRSIGTEKYSVQVYWDDEILEKTVNVETPLFFFEREL